MITIPRSVTLAFLGVLLSSVPGHAQCDTTTGPGPGDVKTAIVFVRAVRGGS